MLPELNLAYKHIRVTFGLNLFLEVWRVNSGATGIISACSA